MVLIFSFALLLLFGCSDYERDNIYDQKGVNYGGQGVGGGVSSSSMRSSSSVVGICNGKEYNTTLYNCVLGEIVGSCKGESYYPEYQSCENGKIMNGAEISSSSLSSSSSSIGGGSSSSVASSSSSSGGSSSSSAYLPISYGTLPYEGQNYKTVKIGNQVWMAENLNYAAIGSKCVGASGKEGRLVDDGGRCGTYGRLYNWATAMKLGSSCNASSGCVVQPKHQGICPSGWHIPSDDEWTTLTNYVESQGGCISCSGTRLKATSGWNSGGNGTDNHGFSALPGGYGYSDYDFESVGYGGDWWSSSEGEYGNAYSRVMFFDVEDSFGGYGSKTALFSVRCVLD